MRLPDHPEVIWHDVECHAYGADLPLWRELARAERGPVLDVGAGTGRVALALAADGHEVVALDVEPLLLRALDARVNGARVETVVGDAGALALGRTFGLAIVPMQTLQLLPDRTAFLRGAREHVAAGGLLAIAIADALEPFDPSTAGLPAPDVAEVGGWRFSSQPIAVRIDEGVMRIERIRTAWGPGGERTSERDRIELVLVDAPLLEAEAAAAGFAVEPRREIAPTAEHVGSTVVMLRG